jgi:hypothetical protein
MTRTCHQTAIGGRIVVGFVDRPSTLFAFDRLCWGSV